MAHRVLRGKRDRVLVSAGLHPEYRQVLDTYLAATSIRVERVPLDAHGATDAAALAAASVYFEDAGLNQDQDEIISLGTARAQQYALRNGTMGKPTPFFSAHSLRAL